MSAPRPRCDGGAVSLPILSSSGHAPSAPRVKESRSTRWRFAVLLGVQALIILHIIQWLIQGSTLSPVEPSEAMETAKYGIINTGTVFFALALLSTVIFGRFFCGWGCHVLLLQDGCGWILKKFGVRPRPLRARWLMVVPLGLALYMFVWPLAWRWAILPYLHPDPPRMQITTQFITSDFWATFPGLFMAVPFLFVCGVMTVYFLGQKGYCTYACPYGGFFAPIDRIAPLRIRVNDSCEHCGHCTAVCTSNVRVHEEVAKFGMVVDPGCMKCLDCVSVCPNEALSVSWGRPATFASASPESLPKAHHGSAPVLAVAESERGGAKAHASHTPSAPPHASAKRDTESQAAERPLELPRREEALILVVGVLTLLAVNAPFMPSLPAAAMPVGGIRTSLPLLFSSGVAAIVAFITWKSWRVLRRSNEGFHSFVLRRAGRITGAGWSWLWANAVVFLLVAMVGAQNLALLVANRADRRAVVPATSVFTFDAVMPPPEVLAAAERADAFYEFASLIGRGGIGFVPQVQPWIDLRRAWLAALRRDFVASERLLRSAYAGFPERSPLRPAVATDIVRILWLRGREAEADAWIEPLLADHPQAEFPEWALVFRQRVAMAESEGDMARAITLGRAWLEWHPEGLEAMRRLSLLLVERGSAEEIEEGIALVHRTLDIEPDHAPAWRAIAIGHGRAGREAETEFALRRAVELAPVDWRHWRGLGDFLRATQRIEESNEAFEEARRLQELEARGRLPAPS
ncbi:MAG: 4Fe-4S binding protein [Phycisphaeraceae bacterium]|nr:4Fe-4S binding protein [Phycisphaeraceae bacterium]